MASDSTHPHHLAQLPACSYCNGTGNADGQPAGTWARDFGPEAPAACVVCDGTGEVQPAHAGMRLAVLAARWRLNADCGEYNDANPNGVYMACAEDLDAAQKALGLDERPASGRQGFGEVFNAEADSGNPAEAVIASVLLIPPEGSTLLDDPWAPLAHTDRDDGASGWFFEDQLTDEGCAVTAMALARDGKVQEHGVLTLTLAEDDRPGDPFAWAAVIANTVAAVLESGDPTRLELYAATHWPGARLVYLDAVGKAVTP